MSSLGRLWAGLLAACTPVTWEVPPDLSPPPAASGVALAARLQATATAPCALTIELTAADHQRVIAPPGLVEVVDLPVLGLRPDRSYDVRVTCATVAGRATWEGALATGALPRPFPEITVLAHDPARAEPGLTLLDVSVPGGDGDYVVVLDEAFEVVWLRRKPAPHFLTVTRSREGHLFGNGYPSLLEVDLLGQELARWGPSGDVRVDHPLHHEAVELDDGEMLSLTWRARDVPEVPASYDALDDRGPGTIIDDGVIRLSREGQVLDLHWLSDVLDPSRVGFDGLAPARGVEGAVDWSHANAVVRDPRDGGYIVTLRHQDAVVKLTADGALAWILGAPDGWEEPWASARLQPEGAVSWPFHPHAAELTPAGELLVFDNGNHRTTPYGQTPAPPGAPYSRVVAYRLGLGRGEGSGEVAGTVEEAWAYRETAAGSLYAPAFGDADALPRTGHVLAVFGRTRAIDGVPTAQLGRGESMAHLVELDPAALDAPVAHVVLSSRRTDWPGGFAVYRAERIPGLYPWDGGSE